MSFATENEVIDVTIPVPTGEIVGRWYGNRQVRPILALHGWLDSLGTWDTIIPLLPKHVGILAIDLLGHGRSSKLPKGIYYNSVDFVIIINLIMESYKWDKVSIMAHSLSAIHSYIYAGICPERVDMLINIDILRSRWYSPGERIAQLNTYIEKFIVEDERVSKIPEVEPPAYTYDEVINVMYHGCGKSVDLDKCKHIVDRNINKSTKYPDKYYFSRDGRIKWYIEFITSDEFAAELAKRICKIPFCVVKGSKSDYINEKSDQVLKILRENNPHFEFHEVEGTHHVHLNNPEGVAAVINPFINKHRPPLLDSWAMSNVTDENNTENDTNEQSKWNQKRKKRKSNL